MKVDGYSLTGKGFMRWQPRELGYRDNMRELLSRVELHRTRLREESYTVRSTELSEYGSYEIGITMAYYLLTDMVKRVRKMTSCRIGRPLSLGLLCSGAWMSLYKSK